MGKWAGDSSGLRNRHWHLAGMLLRMALNVIGKQHLVAWLNDSGVIWRGVMWHNDNKLRLDVLIIVCHQ